MHYVFHQTSTGIPCEQRIQFPLPSFTPNAIAVLTDCKQFSGTAFRMKGALLRHGSTQVMRTAIARRGLELPRE